MWFWTKLHVHWGSSSWDWPGFKSHEICQKWGMQAVHGEKWANKWVNNAGWLSGMNEGKRWWLHFLLNVVIEERMWNWWFLFQVINVVSNVWRYNIGHPTESVLTDKCLICDQIWLWCDENLSYFRAMSVPDWIVQWNKCMMKVWDLLISSSWNHCM